MIEGLRIKSTVDLLMLEQVRICKH